MEDRNRLRDEEEEEPSTVRELLTEMKDISEVVVDLAYASLLLDSEEMADEVRSLEARMDRLKHEIRIKTMLSARTLEDAEQLSGLLQVAGAAEAISNAAGDMVGLLGYESEKRPFLSFVLKAGEEKIKSLTLSETSDMVNQTLAELNIEAESGMRVIAIKRGRRWLYDPEEETKLKAGDLLVVRGTEDGYAILSPYVSGERNWGTCQPRGEE
jgi:uncharacterized protein with PhoU and TrkA domain